MTEQSSADRLSLTAQVVAAYVARNAVPRAGLPDVIAQVHSSFQALSSPAVEPMPQLVPAVPIKKSVTPDYIVSLEDGRKFKSMKRYLGLLGMTPAEYRQKWDLPSDYPMVAPNYSAVRSQMAKTIGLGWKQAPAKAKRPRTRK